MATNTTQYFRNAEQVTKVDYAVTGTLGDVFAADATNLRDLTKLICINPTASPITLTIQESDGTNNRTVKVLSIAANAGQSDGIEAIDLLQDPNYNLKGLRIDAFSNYYYRIVPTKKLRASGNGLILIGEIESFVQ